MKNQTNLNGVAHPSATNRAKPGYVRRRSNNSAPNAAAARDIPAKSPRRGIDPAAYLRDVLSRLPAMTNQDNLGALTPTHWTKRA
jgi:hypothetical protein